MGQSRPSSNREYLNLTLVGGECEIQGARSRCWRQISGLVQCVKRAGGIFQLAELNRLPVGQLKLQSQLRQARAVAATRTDWNCRQSGALGARLCVRMRSCKGKAYRGALQKREEVGKVN